MRKRRTAHQWAPGALVAERRGVGGVAPHAAVAMRRLRRLRKHLRTQAAQSSSSNPRFHFA